MGISMIDPDVLQDFYDIVRVGTFRGPYHKPSMKAHHHPYYTWKTYNVQEMFTIVAEFYPYVGERRRANFDQFLTTYGN